MNWDNGSLRPGQYQEMIQEIYRALYRFMPGRNGDPKAGLAYALLTLTSAAAEVEGRPQISRGTDQDNFHHWILMGEQVMARHTIHSIYYTLVDRHVIKPGHPEQEKGGNLPTPEGG